MKTKTEKQQIDKNKMNIIKILLFIILAFVGTIISVTIGLKYLVYLMSGMLLYKVLWD